MEAHCREKHTSSWQAVRLRTLQTEAKRDAANNWQLSREQYQYTTQTRIETFTREACADTRRVVYVDREAAMSSA